MIEVQLEGCIYELNFGYNAKTVVYTNSSSDIPKLYEIARISREKHKRLCAHSKLFKYENKYVVIINYLERNNV